MSSTSHPPNYMEGTVLRDDLGEILRTQGPKVADAVADWMASGVEHVHLVGCGGSYATFVPIELVLQHGSTMPVTIYTGWEFVNRAPMRVNEKSAVVLASHSGTTEEVLAGLEFARSRGAKVMTFSLVNTKLGASADVALEYDSIAANLSKLLLGYLVGVEVLRHTGGSELADELTEGIAALPDRVHATKEATRDFGYELAKRHQDTEMFYLLGTGPLSGLVYQFAVCNLLEMQWKHAAAFNAAEFPHGPLEIVEEGLPVIVLIGTDGSRFVAERARDFAKRQNADVIEFDLADYEGFHPLLAPFALHLPLQWFNWYLGVVRDRPISTRRYMGKVSYATPAGSA